MLIPGTLLQGRYEIIRLIGSGGFGDVYEARNHGTGQTIAIKEIKNAGPRSQREAQTLASLEHYALPRVHDSFVEGSLQYLVMQYVPGEDLGDYLERQPDKRLSQDETLCLINPVLNALVYIHRHKPPIIHRDIKPGNIRITPEGRVYLVDFGIARIDTSDYSATTPDNIDTNPKKQDTTSAFTPGFSPLEQYSGTTSVRSDLYALGATIYTMLTGTPPPDATDRMKAVPFAAPSDTNPTVTPQFEEAVLGLLKIDPAERFQSVEAFRAAIDRRPPRPAWMMWAGGGVAVLVLLLLLVAGFSLMGQGADRGGDDVVVSATSTATLLPAPIPAPTEMPTLTATSTPTLIPTATPTLIPTATLTPTATSTPTATPTETPIPTPLPDAAACGDIPEPVNASVEPATCVYQGTTLVARFTGLTAGEEVSVAVTTPDGQVGTQQTIVGDSGGVKITYDTAALAPGLWQVAVGGAGESAASVAFVVVSP